MFCIKDFKRYKIIGKPGKFTDEDIKKMKEEKEKAKEETSNG